LPERKAVMRRQQRVQEMMHTLPESAQLAIRESLSGNGADNMARRPGSAGR
jgi:phospholipid/cholesterol/gamma-HCH transport system ATP-binding protein